MIEDFDYRWGDLLHEDFMRFWLFSEYKDWVQYLTIDVNGTLIGHSQTPSYYHGKWDCPETSIELDDDLPINDNPANLIWEHPDNDAKLEYLHRECEIMESSLAKERGRSRRLEIQLARTGLLGKFRPGRLDF